MTVTTRKYNPGFLTDDELIASFCVRTNEFESVIETLRECEANSNPHLIVIGPRGSGKTSLLLRVAAEVRRDAQLSSRLFPIVFAEESYQVSTCGEFWLECLSRSAEQAPRNHDAPDLMRTWNDLGAIRDDETLALRCLGSLLDFADREGKRLVLIVENLNMMFADMRDRHAGWRLRKTLQTEPRIMLLASATSRFDDMDNPEEALYDLFRVHSLRPLTTEECAALWKTVSGETPAHEKIRSLQIFTGGNPRMLAIVARFGASLSFRELMHDLLNLVDEHTEYFRHHLESLPGLERRVYLALAEAWKPASTREVADRARMDTNKCSAWLKRLADRGIVSVTGGTARRRLYYLTERMYNIYYLLRRHSGTNRVVEVVVQFMVSFYSPAELPSVRARIAHEARNWSGELAPHKDTVLSTLDNASLELALDRCDEVVERHEAGDARSEKAAAALLRKGMTLERLERLEEALGVFGDVMERFGADDSEFVLEHVANSLLHTGIVFGKSGRNGEALEAFRHVVDRFGKSDSQAFATTVAKARYDEGVTLANMERDYEALAAYDDVIARFATNNSAVLLEVAGNALFNKGVALSNLERDEEALLAYGYLLTRLQDQDIPVLLELVASALFNTGVSLTRLDRECEALEIYGDVIGRFSKSDSPALLAIVARSLTNKGAVLSDQGRKDEAVEAYAEVVDLLEASDFPILDELVSRALLEMADVHLTERRFRAADESITLGFDKEHFVSGNLRILAHASRAIARLEIGDEPGVERDLQAMLAIVSELDQPPTLSIDALMQSTLQLGPERVLDLIQQSCAAEMLLPLVVALQQEIGLEPQVAREVEEVAQDIRKKLSDIRQG